MNIKKDDSQTIREWVKKKLFTFSHNLFYYVYVRSRDLSLLEVFTNCAFRLNRNAIYFILFDQLQLEIIISSSCLHWFPQ